MKQHLTTVSPFNINSLSGMKQLALRLFHGLRLAQLKYNRSYESWVGLVKETNNWEIVRESQIRQVSYFILLGIKGTRPEEDLVMECLTQIIRWTYQSKGTIFIEKGVAYPACLRKEIDLDLQAQ